jgi:hypothetical protein
MIDRWAGRDVDLGLLSEGVKRFFDERLFPSRVEERSKEEFWITAILRRVSGANPTGNVKVTVLGKPNDFEVEFLAGSRSRHVARLSGLATLLGGGALLLRDLKASEELERLENEFWLFIDKQVDSLGKRKDRK